MDAQSESPMRPWSIIGNERVQDFLRNTLRRKQPASAYLFTGPEGIGKGMVAEYFLKSALCHKSTEGVACGTCVSCVAWDRGQHPDAVLHDPETVIGDDAETAGTSAIISVASVRTIIQQLRYRPTLGTYRVALIRHADRLAMQAANAFLKTLEEPMPNTIIVLAAVRADRLPLTVRSRCQELQFHFVDGASIVQHIQQTVQDGERVKNIVALAAGRPGMAITYANNPASYTEYCNDVNAILTLLESPVPQRLQQIAILLKPKTGERLRWVQMRTFLARIRMVIRDALLGAKQSEGYQVNRFAVERLRRCATHYGVQRLARILLQLHDAERQLRRNVNPTMVFENIVLHW